MHSFFVANHPPATRPGSGRHFPVVAVAILLLLPAALRAQYISYAGMQTNLAVTGLLAPLGVAIDAAGNRYISDFGLTNVIKVAADGSQSTINSTLNHPYEIAVDSAGNVYVADHDNNRVLKIAAGGGAQTTVGSGLSSPTSVAVDSAGNVYIVDFGNGRVLKVAAVGGAQTQIAAAQLSTPAAVAVDIYDNLYITDVGDNSLLKVTPSGTVSIVQNNTLIRPPFGVAVDRFGNIFVSSESGSVIMYGGNGVVRPLGSSFGVPFGLATDKAGNLYVADPGHAQIHIVGPGAIDMGQANLCPSSGTQTAPCSQSVTLNYNVQAQTQNITSVAVKVATQGAENLDFTAIANTCTGDFTGNTTCSVTVNFKPSAPGIRLGAVDVVGIVAPANGVVFRGPRGSDRVHPDFVLPAGATELSTVYLHGLATGPLANFDAGVINTLPVTLPNGNYISGLTPDSGGNLYLVEDGFCTVSEFTPPATTTPVAGSGSCGATAGDGGPATSATFHDPWKMALDARGDLYIPDTEDAVIREIDPFTGLISTIAGSAGNRGHTADGALAINATLTRPIAAAADGAGNVFFADWQEHLIRRIDASSGILTTVAGNYSLGPGYSGDGGPATSAQIHTPYAIALDSAGNLYIADNQNNVIRKVDAGTGIITTVAGQGPPASPGYAGDGGPATSALLFDPEGVTVDAAGNIYIADATNILIRKVNAHTGIITTVAGVYDGGDFNGPQGDRYTGDGGSALLAGLSYMEDVAVDGSGNFYIADSDNGVVRKVAATGAIAAFGSFPIGASSSASDVTLVNDGNSALDLSALAASTNFNLSGGDTSCSTSSALTPGESCILGIEFLPTAAGSLTGTITLTDNVGNDATSTQTVALSGTGTAPVATQLALSGVAGTVVLGGNLGTIQVSVETSGGAVVTSSSASVTVTITGPNGYSRAVTATAANGVATFDLSGLTFATAGSYTITATSGELTPASASFTVTASSQAAMLALSSVPSTVAQGGSLGTVQVSVETSGGSVVTSSSASVTVTITGPNGYSQAVTATAASGIATFDLSSLTFATAGSYTITATSGELTPASASFTVTASVPAAKLALSQIPATVAQGANLGTIQVLVETSGGAVVASSSASVTVTITGPNGYSQAVTATAASGIATFDLSSLTFAAAGSYTITASSGELTPASASFTVTASVAQAAQLALSSVPATVAQGANLGMVQVSVETSGGAVVTSSTASITLTLGGPNGYSQTVTVAAVNGVATFDLSAFAFATLGSYTVTASSSGLTSAAAAFVVEQDFTLTPSAGTGTTPTQNVVPGAPAVYQLQLAPAGTTFNAPITLSATGLPAGATYTFNPAVITPGTAAADTTFTVDTAAATASLRNKNLVRGFAVFIPAMFLLPWAKPRSRRSGARRLPLLLVLLSLGIAGLSGCGAGGLFGQPQATYTITVTGTSGALTHSTTVTLTVQ